MARPSFASIVENLFHNGLFTALSFLVGGSVSAVAALNGYPGVAFVLAVVSISLGLFSLVLWLSGAVDAPAENVEVKQAQPDDGDILLQEIVTDGTSDPDHTQVSLRVRNASSKTRDWCLVKINRVQTSHLLVTQGSVSPVSRAFRTTGQQSRGQWSRFSLAPKEWKDVVVGTIHRRFGALTLLYEGGKAHVELTPPAQIDVGIYGAQEPTLTVLTAEKRERDVVLRVGDLSLVVPLEADSPEG